MRWAGHEARMGEDRKVVKLLVGKPEGKRTLRRPRRRCGMDLDGTGYGDSVGSKRGPVAGRCERGDEHSASDATSFIYRLLIVSRYVTQEVTLIR
jgi:hypothetical protein